MILPIATERLVLRRWTRDDAPDLLTCVSHPSFARATPEIEATVGGVRAYIDAQNAYRPFEQDACFDLAIEHRQAGAVIGLPSLVCREHQQAEIGYALGVDYCGAGHATEAARALIAYGFTTRGLHRVQATTSHANRGSWRVMERLGMRREGWLREAAFREGAWMDVLIYAILAEEGSCCIEASP